MSLYSKEHEKFLKSLLKHKVKFLIVGGHAAIYYGVNRNTGDLDVLIEPTQENGKQLISALKDLKLEVPEISLEEFEKPMVLAFGFEPDGIDILNYTPGLEFSQVYKNAVDTVFFDLTIKLIDIR